jgi:hypothetical protein
MTDILELLAARRNELAATDTLTYINQKEINTVFHLEQEIERGRTAEKEAAHYFEFMQTHKWDWRDFRDFTNAKTEENKHE